jgi:hypothetical protein
MAPSIAATATGNTFSGSSINLTAMSVTAGDVIAVMGFVGGGTMSVSGGGLTWTLDTPVLGAAMATATATATTSLTIAVSSTATTSISGYAVDVTGTSGIDVRGATVSGGFITAGSTISCPALTTTQPDLVLGLFCDSNAANGTYTATGGSAIAVHGTFGTEIQDILQSGLGAITPTATYTSTSTVIVASLGLSPAGGGFQPEEDFWPVLPGPVIDLNVTVWQ